MTYVTDKFKDLVESNQLRGIAFAPIPSGNGEQSSSFIRSAAVRGDRTATPHLIDLLFHEDEEVRGLAARALSIFEVVNAEPSIRNALLITGNLDSKERMTSALDHIHNIQTQSQATVQKKQ
jgi:hypothetical protein